MKKHPFIPILFIFLLFLTPISFALEFHKLKVLDLDGDTLVGRKDPDGQKFFYHPDHLGSTDLVTNSTGGIAEETTYEPYGEVVEGGDSRFLFTHKELDKQSGLYYYGARYCDPFFMRFTQPDKNIQDLYNPQDLNRYSYVRNNPYKYVDPNGENPLLAVALVTGSLSAAISAFSQYRSTGSIGLGQTAVAFGAGAVAGLTGYGVGALAASALSGLGAGAAVLGGGALSGVAGGEAFTAIEAALTGQQYSFDPSRAVLNALIGVGTAGVGYKLSEIKAQKFSNLPNEAQGTLKNIERGGPFPYKEDTGVFRNEPPKGGTVRPLPNKPVGYYKEYTVPTPGATNRGTQRIVAGQKGERYYTKNHYKSFTRVRRN